MQNRELCVHRMNVVLCEANCKKLVLTGFVAAFLYLLTEARSRVLEKKPAPGGPLDITDREARNSDPRTFCSRLRLEVSLLTYSGLD